MYMHLALIFVYVLGIVCTDGACVYPFNASTSGEIWISANRGELTISDTMINGYHIEGLINRNFDFHCEENDGDTYLLRAEQKQIIFQETTLFFLCLDIHRSSESIFYYYVRNGVNSFVNAVIFPYKEVVPNITEACQITLPRRNFITLVRKDSSNDFNITCPNELLATFDNLTVTTTTAVSGTAAGSCRGSNVDVCTDRAIIDVDNNCTSTRTLSAEGEYNCLFSLREDGVSYLSLWNRDQSTDESTTYQFSCLAYVRSGDNVYATESPQQCGVNTNHTYTDKGLVLVFTDLSKTCLDAPPTTTEGPPADVSFLYYLFILPGVLFLVWLILLLVSCSLICYKKYGCVCKKITKPYFKLPKWLQKQDTTLIHSDTVWKDKLLKNKLSPLRPKEHGNLSHFKPKRPIDISFFKTSFETGSCPSLEPTEKLSPLYPDTIEDYMRGKIPRYPSGLSLYSIDSVVFEYKRSHCTHWLKQSNTTSDDISDSCSQSTVYSQ